MSTRTFVTRTFTEEEQRMVIRALIAIRPHVQDGEREVIDGIIRDGWVAQPTMRTP